jgi:glycine/D-amino acid oxidase-like deaminating enzyme
VTDVLVVGAGICGLGAACELSRRGGDVSVLERERAERAVLAERAEQAVLGARGRRAGCARGARALT